MDMIRDSSSLDSDNDYLPDDVELELGTDPENKDTDRDGLDDYSEIFDVVTSFEEPIPDFDRDQIIAPLDNDDDGDGYNDGDLVDSDGDGISNYLEMYGYTYDMSTGQYQLWDGDRYAKPYYKSDPYQKSTDQDPYDDNVEASGIHQDVSVVEPGTLPMVPAYPDIVVTLEGYSVTLNEEITWTDGESLAVGTTWVQTTESTHSYTGEENWEAGIEVGIAAGPTGGLSGKTHFNYGQSNSVTTASSTSQSTGGSILSQSEWSKATTTNPTDAARIKLFLKVWNRGTAVASNILPTVTLLIGGHNIATFEPGNAQVNLLAPDDVYPEAPGVYWVADSIDTGAGIVPISLTLSELKALESGAPVRLVMTQMAADVMQRDEQSGIYQSVGDWNEYKARIEAVSAFISLDKGDDTPIRSYVYADDRPSSPKVTLGDALVWVAGGRITDNDDYTIETRNPQTGALEEIIISGGTDAGWTFAIDAETYRANGYEWDGEDSWQLTGTDNLEGDLLNLKLTPKSVIIAKAPRSDITGDPKPVIHYAYLDRTTGGYHTVVSDYNGISSVEFIDKAGELRLMQEDIPGTNFYTYYPDGDIDNYSDGYAPEGTEKVLVTNLSEGTDDKLFTNTYVPEIIPKPKLNGLTVDIANHKLSVLASSAVGIEKVVAYHHDFSNGYCDMLQSPNPFLDPSPYVCTLENDWIWVDGITVVAFASDGQDAYLVTNAEHVSGDIVASQNFESTFRFIYPESTMPATMPVIDLNYSDSFYDQPWPAATHTFKPSLGFDIWFRNEPSNAHFYMMINDLVDAMPYTQSWFDDITKDDIIASMATASSAKYFVIVRGADDVNVYVLKLTNSDGSFRYAKVKVNIIEATLPDYVSFRVEWVTFL